MNETHPFWHWYTATTARPFWSPAKYKVSPFKNISLFFFISTRPYNQTFNFTCSLHSLLTLVHWLYSVEKYSRAGQATDDNRAHAHCILNTYFQTYTRNMQYLLIFHCNKGCTNELHCYVMRTFPALLNVKPCGNVTELLDSRRLKYIIAFLSAQCFILLLPSYSSF